MSGFCKLFLIACWMVSVSASAVAEIIPPRCTKATYPELTRELKGRGNVTLVFFASWCSSCKPHLETPPSQNAVYIATFDEPSSAQRVLNHFEITAPCYIDNGVAHHFGIRSLPAVRLVAF